MVAPKYNIYVREFSLVCILDCGTTKKAKQVPITPSVLVMELNEPAG